MASVASEKLQNRQLLRQSDELTFNDLLPNRPLHYVVVIVLALLGVVAGLVNGIRSTRLYTSSATVELNTAISGVGIRDLSTSTTTQNGTATEFTLDMTTLQDVLSSDQIALSVIHRLNLLTQVPYSTTVDGKQKKVTSEQDRDQVLERDPQIRDRTLSLFRKGLLVAPVKGSRLLTVSYTDPDPQRATLIANAVVSSYLTNYAADRTSENSRASATLIQQLAELKRHAEETQKEIGKLEESSGLLGITISGSAVQSGSGSVADPTSNPAYQRLQSLNLELTRLEILRVGKESIYRMTQSDDPEAILQASSSNQSNSVPGENSSVSRSLRLIESLHTQEASLRLRLASLQLTYGSDNPIIVEIDKQLKAIAVQKQQEVRNVRQAAKVEYLVAVSTEDALRKSVVAQQAIVGTMGTNMTTLTFLQQDESNTRGLYQNIYNRVQEANVAVGLNSQPVSMVEPARVPSHPSSPDIKRNLIVGFVLGAFFGYVLMLFQKYREPSENLLVANARGN